MKQLKGCSYGLVRSHVNVISQEIDGVPRNGSLHGSTVTVTIMIWGSLDKVPRLDKHVIEELRAGAFPGDSLVDMSSYLRKPCGAVSNHASELVCAASDTARQRFKRESHRMVRVPMQRLGLLARGANVLIQQ